MSCMWLGQLAIVMEMDPPNLYRVEVDINNALNAQALGTRNNRNFLGLNSKICLSFPRSKTELEIRIDGAH